MTTRGLRIAIAWLCAGAVTAAGCNGKDGSGFTRPSSTGSGAAGGGAATPDPHDPGKTPTVFTGTRLTGWEPGCAQALEAARAAPPFERFALVARACPACGVDWKPLADAMRLDDHGTMLAERRDVDQVILACGTSCTGSSAMMVRDGFDQIKDTRTIDRPWRTMAKQCRGALAPSPDERFASAPWYVLTHVSRALAGGSAAKVAITQPLELPVPSAMVTGGVGLDMPHATTVLAEMADVYVTVLAKSVHVAPAARAILDTDGITTPNAELYPGDPVELPALAKRLADTGGGKVALLVPYAAPATRALDVLTAIGAKPVVHLGAFAPMANAGWHEIPRLVTPRLALALPTSGVPIVLSLANGGWSGRLHGGKELHSICGTPGGTLDSAGVKRLVAGLVERSKTDPIGGEAIVGVGTDVTIEELATAIDELGARGITSVTVRAHAPDEWPKDPAACN